MIESQRQLEALLLNPREDLSIEVKSWLDLNERGHQATLAKAIMALANHGGGFLILGLKEDAAGQFHDDPSRPENLDIYSQDRIGGIIDRYASPSFHCNVHLIENPNTNLVNPIIQIPGSHKEPIQCQKGSPDNKTLIAGKYYIRRQGPESAEPASPNEWRDLIMKCVRNGREELTETIRHIINYDENENSKARDSDSERSDVTTLREWADSAEYDWFEADSSKSPPPYGYYSIRYKVMGAQSEPTRPELMNMIERARINHSGWPPFMVFNRSPISPQPMGTYIQANLNESGDRFLKQPSHSDFWRISQSGMGVLLRGYNEDDPVTDRTAGRDFNLTTPIWRTAEAMLQAANFAQQFQDENTEVYFEVKWVGLKGRTLTASGNRSLSYGRTCSLNEYINAVNFRSQNLPDTLVEQTHELLKPLYESFEFFELPLIIVDQEVSKMRECHL